MNNKKQIVIDNLKVNDKSDDSSEAICVKKKKITKEREISILLLSVSLVFTVCFFVPADTFIANQNEFVISAPRILLPLLTTSVVVLLLMILAFNVVLLIDLKLWRVMQALIGGFLIASYWQVMFANGKMVHINGSLTVYTEESFEYDINLLFYLVILFIPFMMLVLSDKLKNNKLKCNVINGVTFISILIFMMQSVGLGARVLKTGIIKMNDDQLNKYLSIDDIMDLNSKRNVVVFLTDRLDASWMETELECYPELRNKLEGFTFYSNNVGCYTNTFPSVTDMLTNYQYSGEEWIDYFADAWNSETLPSRLHNNGYKVNLLIDNLTTYSSFDEISDQCDNIRYSSGNIDFNYFGPNGILRTMARFSFGKIYPYRAKNAFLGGMTADFSRDFYISKNEDIACFKGSVGIDSDMGLYNYFCTHQMKATCDQPTFTFIHLNFAHDENEELASLDPSFDGTNDKAKNIRGGFKLIEMYLDQMKKSGIYDTSTIILIGDHGRPPAEIEYADREKLSTIELDGDIRTAVLVKPEGVDRNPLIIDRDTELSNSEFAATVLEYAGVDKTGFGPSFIDVKSMDKNDIPERILHVYCWKGIGRVDDILKYKVTGDASDFNNWEVIERFGISVDE